MGDEWTGRCHRLPEAVYLTVLCVRGSPSPLQAITMPTAATAATPAPDGSSRRPTPTP